MTFSNVIVLGAGGIGSAVGALLSKTIKVTLIGREAHIDAIKQNGLLLTGGKEEQYNLEASTCVQSVTDKTLMIVATKAHDLQSGLSQIRDKIKGDTVILLLQNGIGNEKVARQVLGGKIKILRGVTEMATEFFQPGQIKYWRGTTYIESDGVGDDVVALFNAGELPVQIDAEMQKRVWTKAVVNCVINPLSAIFAVKDCEIASDWLKPIRHHIAAECSRVAATESIKLPGGLADQIDVDARGYANYSSMCQDIMQRRKTEIDFLNGKIVELAGRNRISVPTNETVFRFIKYLEEKNELRKD